MNIDQPLKKGSVYQDQCSRDTYTYIRQITGAVKHGPGKTRQWRREEGRDLTVEYRRTWRRKGHGQQGQAVHGVRVN